MVTVTRRDKDHTRAGWMTPADRLVADQDGVYYKLSDAAQLVGKSPTTLRRLMRDARVKAPSYQIRQGDMVVYLFTPDDIEEIRAYYGSQKPQKRQETPA